MRLKIWSESMDLVQTIYNATSQFPSHEKFGIVSQMTRAAVSIPSNIAEGAGRDTDKEFCHFLSIALGSSYELHTQVILCERIGYFDHEQSATLQDLIVKEQQLIMSFRHKLSTNQQPILH